MIKKPTTNQSIPQTSDERESLRSAVADYALTHRLVTPLSMEELSDHAMMLAPHPDLVDGLAGADGADGLRPRS